MTRREIESNRTFLLGFTWGDYDSLGKLTEAGLARAAHAGKSLSNLGLKHITILHADQVPGTEIGQILSDEIDESRLVASSLLSVVGNNPRCVQSMERVIDRVLDYSHVEVNHDDGLVVVTPASLVSYAQGEQNSLKWGRGVSLAEPVPFDVNNWDPSVYDPVVAQRTEEAAWVRGQEVYITRLAS